MHGDSSIPAQTRTCELRSHDRASGLRSVLPGLALVLAIALAAIAMERLPGLQSNGFGALTLAIVLGIVVGNTFYGRIALPCGEGVHLARQSLLRLGIVLYGFRLTFQDVAHVGWAGLLIDALMLSSTFMFARFFGERLLGLERDMAVLIGAGSAICGAAAVMATAPVLRARSERAAIAVSTVVAFGTAMMFLYPVLYRSQLFGFWPASTSAFGIYAGSTIHEVAQVLAAGRAIDPAVADAAVIAKMVRVMMLAPFLILLSAACRPVRSQDGVRRSLAIPWFAFAFIASVGVNSLLSLSPSVLAGIGAIDTLMLSMAMAALGLGTQIGAVRRAGLRPLLLAALLFAWLVVGGAAINYAVETLTK